MINAWTESLQYLFKSGLQQGYFPGGVFKILKVVVLNYNSASCPSFFKLFQFVQVLCNNWVIVNVMILGKVSRHVYGSSLDLPSYFWSFIQSAKMLKFRRNTSIMPFAQQNVETISGTMLVNAEIKLVCKTTD